MKIEPWLVHGGYRMAYVWWERTEQGNDEFHKWVPGHLEVYATKAECEAAIKVFREARADG